jgi:hypothetical protein
MAAPTKSKQIQKRIRFSGLPVVEAPQKRKAPREIPWSLRTEEFSRIDLEATAKAHDVLTIERTEGWQKHAIPALKTVDSGRKMAHALYTSSELERVSLFAFLTGNTIKDARTLLCSDKGEAARRLLGFDKPRNPVKRHARMKLLDGVPSEASLCRHHKRFDLYWRMSVLEKVALDLRDQHLSYSSFREEIRRVGKDGSTVLTHYNAPLIDRKTGEILNADRVTAPDAGYVSHRTAPPEKAGAGWCLVAAVTLETRIPVVLPVVERNGHPETEMGMQIAETLKQEIKPALEGKIGVMVMDGGFHDQELRATLHDAGYLESCHVSSHSASEGTQQSVKTKNKRRYKIDGFPNWNANGHREIECKCGQRPAKRIETLKNGALSVGVEGDCPKCGHISITAGDWRLSNGSFVRCAPGTPLKKRDYTLGNPLTYNDPLAERYGNLRHGHGEGYFAQLARRFGVNHGKRWVRTGDRVRLESTLAFIAIHALSMEYRERNGEVPDASSPPPQALAA